MHWLEKITNDLLLASILFTSNIIDDTRQKPRMCINNISYIVYENSVGIPIALIVEKDAQGNFLPLRRIGFIKMNDDFLNQNQATQSNQVQIQRVKLCGVWKGQSKKGVTFLSGGLSYDSVLEIWPNNKREGKNDPDFQVFISTRIKKDSHMTPSDEVSVDPTPPNVNEVPF